MTGKKPKPTPPTNEVVADLGEAPPEPAEFDPIKDDDVPDYDAEHKEEDA